MTVAVAAGLSLAPLRGTSATALASLPGLSSLAGISGKLLAVFSLPGDAPALAVAGDTAKAGVYRLAGAATAVLSNASLIVMRPFSAKMNGRIGSYRLGSWPYEGLTPRSPSYASPKGFIEVTPENFGTRVSEHFTVGEFLTKDQREVWPKYLVLDRRLLDKLELTIAELNRMGYPVKDLSIMSGFRTPVYNERGVGAGGRSAVSRHQYGDASDVYPDDDHDGRLDDLNRDGRVDLKDARILASAAEAVERKNPQLVGGIGIYPATSTHGPFVHIDARGTRARWNG
ncbi:MAG TPA: hypothetical protein VGB47_01745 [Thermoanaerobaculia bacterium]